MVKQSENSIKFLQYRTENLELFNKRVKLVLNLMGDLRPAFEQMAEDFYISNQAIFKLKSPGGYDDLTESTKRNKRYVTRKLTGKSFLYPILKRTGRLEASVTDRGSGEAFEYIARDHMVLDTEVPYGPFHQLGTRKMVPRPYFFIGPESRQFAELDREGLGGRLTRWTNILEDTVNEYLKALKK